MRVFIESNMEKNHQKEVFNILTCMLMVASGCVRQRDSAPAAATKAQSPFVYEERIGIAQIQREKSDGCLALYNPSIKPGAKVGLVDQPDSMQLIESPSVNEAIVVELLSQECGAHIATGNWIGSGPSFYRIRIAKEWQGNQNVFGVLDPASPIVVYEG